MKLVSLRRPSFPLNNRTTDNSVTKTRRTMNRSAAGMVLAAIAVGFWGWTSSSSSPIENSEAHVSSKRIRPEQATESSTAPTASHSNGDADSEIWSRPLQFGFRERSDSVASATAMSTTVPSAPVVVPKGTNSKDSGLRLVGTVIEQGRSMAIAIDALGRLDFRGVGDFVQLDPQGVRIDSVSDRSVRISFQGKSVDWQMGQSLRMESDATSSEPEMPTPIVLPMRPKRTLEEELEILNGPPSDNPL